MKKIVKTISRNEMYNQYCKGGYEEIYTFPEYVKSQKDKGIAIAEQHALNPCYYCGVEVPEGEMLCEVCKY